MLCLARDWALDLSPYLDFIVMHQREMLKNASPGGCAVFPYATSLCGTSHPWENAFTSLWAAPGTHSRGPEPPGSPQPRGVAREPASCAPHRCTGAARALGRFSEELCFNVAI